MTTVRDVMTADLAVIDTASNLADAAALMAEYRVGALPIVDRDGQACGVLTDRDIVLKCLATGPDPYMVNAARCAEDPPFEIDANERVGRAAEMMAEHGVNRLLVGTHEEVVGIVCWRDLAIGMTTDEFGTVMQRVFSVPEARRAALASETDPVGAHAFFTHFWDRIALLRPGQRRANTTRQAE